jgi:hypothetical protein
MTVHILHENEDWLPPLRDALDEAGVPYDEWFVDTGHFDLHRSPPPGVYLNRMSASSHTRGHEHGVEHTRQLLAWLERHGRRVINGSNAFALEVSKVRQYAALARAGVRVPDTRTVVGGPEALLDAAEDVPLPFITKHNCGGKGLGVQLFESREAFADFVRSDRFAPSPDGVTLLQQYVEPADGTITRCEFVDGELVYAVRADTSDGFELCPADACRTDGAPPEANGAEANGTDDASLFALREEVPGGLVEKYRAFLEAEQIDVAGIEFIEDARGACWTYDVNGTTNYNPAMEAAGPRSAWAAVADFLQGALEAEAPAAS